MAKKDITEVSGPTQFRAGDEQVEIARRGGIASGEARKRKKLFRDELEALLPLTDIGKDNKPVINPLTGEEQSIQQTITMQWLLKARKGDMKAIKLILDTLGELVVKTENKHEISTPVIVVADQTEKEAIERIKAKNEG